MDATSVTALGVIYALIKIVEKLIEKREKQKTPSYRDSFLEQLGGMMEANTKLLNSISAKQERFEPIIMSVDAETNYPHIWANNKQAKRTHDNVNTLVETTHELARMVGDTHDLIKKKAA